MIDFLKRNKCEMKALNADLMLAAPVTGEQCDTKFRILKKKYLDCIEKNNKTGASPKYCDHYELLDEIWGCSDQATPKAIGGSLKGLQKNASAKWIKKEMMRMKMNRRRHRESETENQLRLLLKHFRTT